MKKNLVSLIVQSLRDDPHGWVEGQHTLTHIASRYSIWIANGLSFCGQRNPSEQSYGFIGKFKVWRAYKRRQGVAGEEFLLKGIDYNEYLRRDIDRKKHIIDKLTDDIKKLEATL